MATISSADLSAARRAVCNSDEALSNRQKGVLNAAFQAIEDTWQANQAAFSAAINAATSPVVLTAAQKKLIGREWAAWKFRIGG
jgi:hypothetical protein